MRWAALWVVVSLSLAQNTPSEEEIWKQFSDWLANAPASDSPKELQQSYVAHLKASGVPEAEAERQRAILLGQLRTRPDAWRVIFNGVYRNPNATFRTEPNALLVSAVEGVRPGRALDAGMGQGRNSVFLALKGWNVTGFDVSDEGIAVAQRNAAKAGVKLDARVQSHEHFDFGVSQGDLIVITYEPFPVTDPAYAAKLFRALRPGGLLVIESFASDSTAPVRRPVDIDPPKLKAALAEFELLKFEDREDVPDWDSQKTRLVRAVARKKK